MKWVHISKTPFCECLIGSVGDYFTKVAPPAKGRRSYWSLKGSTRFFLAPEALLAHVPYPGGEQVNLMKTMRTLLLWMLPTVSFALSGAGLAGKVKDDLAEELEKTTCPSQTGSKLFKYTGKDQVFTVPSGITELRVRLACRRFPPIATVFLKSRHCESHASKYPIVCVLQVLTFVQILFQLRSRLTYLHYTCSLARAGVSFWSRRRRWRNQRAWF